MSDRKKAPAPAPVTRQRPPAKKAAPPGSSAQPKATTRTDDFSQTPVTSGQSVTTPSTGRMPLTKSTKRPLGGMNQTLFPPSVRLPEIDPTTIPPDFVKPIPAGHLQIDWSSLRMPFATRGIPLTTRDLDQIEANWRATYGWVTNFGVPADLALKIANIGTPRAYDTALQRDFPDPEVRMDRAYEKLPPGEAVPTKFVVPLDPAISAGVNRVAKKVFHKKLNFDFTF